MPGPTQDLAAPADSQTVDWTPADYVAALDQLVLDRRRLGCRPVEATLSITGKELFRQSRRRKPGPPEARVVLRQTWWVRKRRTQADNSDAVIFLERAKGCGAEEPLDLRCANVVALRRARDLPPTTKGRR